MNAIERKANEDVPVATDREHNKQPEWQPVSEFPGFSFPRDTSEHYTPWLLVRSTVGDNGSRPLPAGAAHWESPDVWVESTLGIDQPIPGQDNTLFARVTNFGLQDATGVIARFWVAYPSLAINTPSLIGLGYANIQSGDSAIVECLTKWVPDSVNGGHQCLIVEAFIPGFDDLTAPLDPKYDRHVGQKNEQLVVVAPGEFFVTNVEAANAMSMAQDLTFEVQALPQTLAAAPLLAARARAVPLKPLPAAAPLPLTFRLDNSSAVFTPPSAVFARRLLNQTLEEVAGNAKYCSAPAQISHTSRFEPWEARKIQVTGQMPKNARPGQTHSFRIVQRAGRMITGGYTVKIVVGELKPRKEADQTAAEQECKRKSEPPAA